MHLQRCNSLYFTVNFLKSYLLKILMAVRKTEQIKTPSGSFFDSLVCNPHIPSGHEKSGASDSAVLCEELDRGGEARSGTDLPFVI